MSILIKGDVKGDIISDGGVKNETHYHYGNEFRTVTDGGQQKQQEETKMPDALCTEEAMVYWRRLEEKGFVDNRHLLLESTTRQQAMYIAEAFAEKAGIKNKWKPFEGLWGISHLAQEKNKFLETGKSPSRSDEIDTIFSN